MANATDVDPEVVGESEGGEFLSASWEEFRKRLAEVVDERGKLLLPATDIEGASSGTRLPDALQLDRSFETFGETFRCMIRLLLKGAALMNKPRRYGGETLTLVQTVVEGLDATGPVGLDRIGLEEEALQELWDRLRQVPFPFRFDLRSKLDMGVLAGVELRINKSARAALRKAVPVEARNELVSAIDDLFSQAPDSPRDALVAYRLACHLHEWKHSAAAEKELRGKVSALPSDPETRDPEDYTGDEEMSAQDIADLKKGQAEMLEGLKSLQARVDVMPEKADVTQVRVDMHKDLQGIEGRLGKVEGELQTTNAWSMRIFIAICVGIALAVFKDRLGL